MATTIILKNSSVAGKVPDPSVLQAGELGVNLKDQKLYSKDADGNVFELGRGSTDSGGSGDKPGSPEVGDLYYDTDLDVLLVWNGSEWETVGSVTSVNGKTGEVVLEASDVGALAPGDDISELNNDAGYLTSADLPDDTLWLQTTGAIYPKDLSNNVQVGGTAADPKIELNATGGASFSDRIIAPQIGNVGGNPGFIYFPGSTFIPGSISPNSNYIYNGSASSDEGTYFANTPFTNVSDLTALMANDGSFRLGGTLPSAPNISLNASGSATFLGDVAIGDSTTFRDNAAIIAALPEAIRERFKSALSKWEKATPYVPEDPSTLPADETLREAIIRVTNAGKINLNSDGSASFAGTITGNTTIDAGVIFRGDNNAAKRVEFLGDGSAYFFGKVTAANYNLESLPSLP